MRDITSAKPTNRLVASAAAAVAVALLVTIGIAASAATPGNEAPTVTIVRDSLEIDTAQAAALADGRVTHAEMREALERVVDCVRTKGFKAELVDFTEGLGWHLRTSGETDALADAADSALTICRSSHASAVMDRYLSDGR